MSRGDYLGKSIRGNYNQETQEEEQYNAGYSRIRRRGASEGEVIKQMAEANMPQKMHSTQKV